MNVTRRSFLSTAATTAAALTTLTAAAPEAEAAPNLVYRHADWDYAPFDKLLAFKGRGRQLYDCHPIANGDFFGAIKNSFNGLQFGYGIPAADIRIVGAMHGPANLLNFDDSMWAKYAIGEYLKLNDPATGKPATRNPFFAKRTPAGSSDPNDRSGIYHDTSIEALMARGFQMLSCHNSTEGQAQALIAKNGLKVPVEDIVLDLQTHSLPGVIAVPAMVAAIAMLQTEGHYAYIVAP
jgi:intracellular sulfur oxidation DsrE/DsrF family protein